MGDISYKMVWTETGLSDVVDKGIVGVQKLNTAVSNIIAKFERKAQIAAMGADAYALSQAKAKGATQQALEYIMSLQTIVRTTDELKEKTAKAAAETERLNAVRRQQFMSTIMDDGPPAPLAPNESNMMLKRLRHDPANQGQTKNSRLAQMSLEASRAVEDAVAGGAYGGIKGAIMGASNNISQLGSFMGPQAAIVASLTSTVAVLGITAVNVWEKWGDSTEKQQKRLDALRSTLENQISKLHDEIALRKELQSIEETTGKKQAERLLKEKTLNISDMEAEQRLKRQQVQEMIMSVGFTGGHSIADLQAAKSDPNLMFAKEGLGAGFLDINRGKITDEFIALAMKTQQEADMMSHKVHSAKIGQEEAKRVLSRETVAEQGKEMDDAMASRKEAKLEDAEARNSRKAARKKQEDSLSNLRLGLMGGNVEEDNRQKAVRLELERRERDREIELAQKSGLINSSKASEMKMESLAKRDREMQEVFKPSSQQSQSGTKAQALDIRSSEGMAQLLKAINAKNDDKVQKQLDLTERIAKAVEDANNIKPEKIEVMVF